MVTDFKYDAAFSFLPQDEPLATRLNDLLTGRLTTFLYSRQQEAIAGTDGEQAFKGITGGDRSSYPWYEKAEGFRRDKPIVRQWARRSNSTSSGSR